MSINWTGAYLPGPLLNNLEHKKYISIEPVHNHWKYQKYISIEACLRWCNKFVYHNRRWCVWYIHWNRATVWETENLSWTFYICFREATLLHFLKTKLFNMIFFHQIYPKQCNLGSRSYKGKEKERSGRLITKHTKTQDPYWLSGLSN